MGAIGNRGLTKWLAIGCGVGFLTLAHADTSLIIELPIPPPDPPVQSTTVRAEPPRNEPVRRQQAIGRLGVTVNATPIYAARSVNSRLFARCVAQTYLAITHEAGAWYGVLMVDGSIGWTPRQHVRLLDYEVLPVSSGTVGVASERIVQTALRFLGIPYRWGGTSYNGLDCSGFVQKVFALNGIRLPRVCSQQVKVGMPILDLSLLQPGDRLFFRSRRELYSHTGIYIGSGYFIHAARSPGRVVISHVSEPKYLNTLVAIRR